MFIAMLARAMHMKHADQNEVIINKEKLTSTSVECNGAHYAAEIWSDSENALHGMRARTRRVDMQ